MTESTYLHLFKRLQNPSYVFSAPLRSLGAILAKHVSQLTIIIKYTLSISNDIISFAVGL